MFPVHLSPLVYSLCSGAPDTHNENVLRVRLMLFLQGTLKKLAINNASIEMHFFTHYLKCTNKDSCLSLLDCYPNDHKKRTQVKAGYTVNTE